jgi:hypothetical protein
MTLICRLPMTADSSDDDVQATANLATVQTIRARYGSMIHPAARLANGPAAVIEKYCPC